MTSQILEKVTVLSEIKLELLRMYFNRLDKVCPSLWCHTVVETTPKKAKFEKS